MKQEESMRSHQLFLLTIVDLELAIFDVPRHQVQLRFESPFVDSDKAGNPPFSPERF
jgi:hypothetical protein